MTVNKAKKTVKEWLDKNNISYIRLQGKTIGFQDLTRNDDIFVFIYGAQPNPKFKELVNIAKQNNFYIDLKK